jgi:hypothetical protein
MGVNTWCEDTKKWIDDEAHWNTVPEKVENYHEIQSSSLQKALPKEECWRPKE